MHTLSKHTAVSVKRLTSALLVLAMLLIAGGCASTGAPPLSDQELAFHDAPLVEQTAQQPHRSIDDIRKQLDSWHRWDRDCVAELEERQDAILNLSRSLTSADVSRSARLKIHGVINFAQIEIARGNYFLAIEALNRTRTLSSLSPYNVAHAFNALSLAYAKLGDTRRARRAAGAASSLWIRSTNPNSNSLGQFYGNLSEAQIAQAEGWMRLSEIYYRRAFDDIFAMWSGVDLNYLHAEFAANLLSQGRLAEAEQEARLAVLDGQYTAFTLSITANSVTKLSEILFEQGRLKDAEYLAQQALSMQQFDCPTHDSISLANARAALARTLAVQGQWGAARDQYARIAWALTDNRPYLDRLYTTDVEWALALVETGAITKAAAQIQRAYELTVNQHGRNSVQAAEMLAFRAVVKAKSGDLHGSLQDFDDSLPTLLDTGSGKIGVGTRRLGSYRFRLIVDTYLDALSRVPEKIDAKSDSDPTHPFRIVDALRGRRVQTALTYSNVRAAVRDPELAELIRQIQDTEVQLTTRLMSLSSNLSRPQDEIDTKLVKALRAQVDEHSATLDRLNGEIEQRFPDYADLTNPKPATVPAVQELLSSTEALISIYTGASRSYIWAIPSSGRPSYAAVPIGRAQVSQKVAELRRALDPRATRLGDIPTFDVDSAHEIFASFLRPVEAGWRGAKHLIVVTDGALGQLPFSLLPLSPDKATDDTQVMFDSYRNVQWLAKTHAISALPTAASLVTLRSTQRDTARERPFVGFGDPVFSTGTSGHRTSEVAAAGLDKRATHLRAVQLRNSPLTRTFASADVADLPRLPDTADEVRSIAAVLGAQLDRDVYLGTRASEINVKSANLAAYRIVAFATHGLLPGDLDGLLEPALALSNPELTGGEDDGLLTLGEILGLNLNADWVVLSACNTAAGDGAGAEAVSGLGRAFFYAGTQALLVSHWPVETTSAKAITTNLFNFQFHDPSLSRSEALRRTMMALIDGPGFVDPVAGTPLFSYAHPIFWAPFAIVGNGL